MPNNLNQLSYLDLTRCHLSDVSALSRFLVLEICRLCDNKIVLDTIPTNLINLRELDLRECGIDDVSSLARLPSLEHVLLAPAAAFNCEKVPEGFDITYEYF